MNADSVKSWLKKKKARGAVSNCLLGALAFVAGVVVLFLTFWFTYAVIWIAWPGVSALSDLALGKKLHLSHGIRLVCSGVFIVLLFIQNLRTSPWHWGDYPHQDYSFALAGHHHPGVMSPLVLLLHPGASANMIADILLSGPRLVTGGWNMVMEGLRLRRMDETGCAELLAFLAGRITAVPYDELRSAGWEEWFPHLRCIEGVVFLEKGLSLSSELRHELVTLKGT
jgi:hypothetical protein